MASHAEGPWKLVGYKKIDVMSSKGEFVAQVRGLGGVERVQANARLIVLAPEMLAAMKERDCVCAVQGRSRCQSCDKMDAIISRV